MIDICFTCPDGKTQRVCKTSPVQSRRGAEQYEREVRQALLDGSFQREEEVVPTFEEFSREFMATYVAANNKPSERMSKEYIFRLHLLPAFGRRRLDSITRRDVEQFKAKCIEGGLAPKSINNMLTVLGRMLRYAQELDVITTVPRIKFMKVAAPKIDFLSFDELERLLVTAEQETEALAAILCAAQAGLRAGEVRALRWEDIDFIAGQVTVQRTDYRGHLGTPKGGRLRVLPLTRRLARSLKAQRHLRGPWVFCDEAGERWSRGEVDVRLWRSCRKAGLRKMGWHQMRHTFCSHLAMLGVPARTIMELAGHASLTTTQRYMHLSPSAGREAMDLLDAPRKHNANSGQAVEKAQ